MAAHGMLQSNAMAALKKAGAAQRAAKLSRVFRISIENVENMQSYSDPTYVLVRDPRLKAHFLTENESRVVLVYGIRN